MKKSDYKRPSRPRVMGFAIKLILRNTNNLHLYITEAPSTGATGFLTLRKLQTPVREAFSKPRKLQTPVREAFSKPRKLAAECRKVSQVCEGLKRQEWYNCHIKVPTM
tara:strand:+ start:18085 stop:18408 length:324 start_codon:yes stop_codon:yes gene_type:complete